MSSLGERYLKERGVAFAAHEYDFRKKGAEAAAESLGLPLDAMLKTLVVRLDDGRCVLLLVPGNKQVSMRSFARALEVRGAELASERDAERLTGYQVGGIGPFGTRTALSVFVDLSAVEHETLYVNGGRRGLILGLAQADLLRAAQAELVDVGLEL